MRGCAPELVHATCVAVGRDGVLLRGASGSGKSDLALRLIFQTWRVQGLTAARQPKLVSDDQVLVRRERQRLIATAPTEIAGLIEVRGLGLVEVPSAAEAEIRLVIDLVARELVPRMPPEAETATIRGLDVPRAVLHAFDASAPLKVLLALAAWGRPARAE